MLDFKALSSAIWIMILTLGGIFASASESADVVKARKENFKEIGGSFKSLQDEIRSPHPDVNAIGSAARVVAQRAEIVSKLFPADTGADTVAETRAKPDIWRNKADFDALMSEFVSASAKLFMAVRANDQEAMPALYKQVAKACKSCHDSYRVPE